MNPSVLELESTIYNKAIFSQDKKYRYKLTTTWDENKKKATIIMLNPSKASELKSDKTVMNVTNFLIDTNEYGSLSIVNLFAYISTDPTQLFHRNKELEEVNDKYILQAVEKSDLIIIAWGSYIKDHVKRKRKVEEMLKSYKYKIKCFKDDKGKKPRHPRDLTDKWTLDNYEFTFI